MTWASWLWIKFNIHLDSITSKNNMTWASWLWIKIRLVKIILMFYGPTEYYSTVSPKNSVTISN